MGVDHYTCPICEEIRADTDEYHHCAGCGARWCDWCHADTWIYAGKMRCDFCWKDCTEPIPESELLELALSMLPMNRAELEEMWLKTAPQKYRVPRDRFHCTRCKGPCASSRCERVGEDHCPDDPPSDDNDSDNAAVDRYRGYCCAAQGLPLHKQCAQCQEWTNRRVAVALLACRSRRKTVLTQVPRDVLQQALIVPWVLPHVYQEPGKPKKKKGRK